MRTNLSKFLLCWTLLLLSGCGGGGGGSSSSSSSYTATPSVFINSSTINNAVTLGFLRQMIFNGDYLYVVDSAAATGAVVGRVRKFNSSSGAYVTTVIATGGAADQQNSVYSVAVNNGNIFVTGTDNSGGLTGTGLINLTSNTSNKTGLNINSPYGLAIDPDPVNPRIYISDIGGTGNKVAIYDIAASPPTQTTPAKTVASNPVGLAYDSSGYIYVTTQTGGSNGVYKIPTSSPYTPSAFANSSLFKMPNGIAVRSSPKEIYVVDTGTTDTNSSVLKISSDGLTVTKFLDGASSSSMLCSPIGAAINGNVLYISNGLCLSSNVNYPYAKSVIKVTLDN